MDISAIDGVPCTETSPEGPCGTMARQLAALPPGQKPTELIYCFDPDGPTSRDGLPRPTTATTSTSVTTRSG
jgi:hypothetical protein